MYQVEAWSALLKTRRAELAVPSRLGVSGNVLALGFTSLLTDVSSEMVSTVLPIYLVLHLGLTPLHFGIVDSVYNGASALVRLLSGVLADRYHRCKELAFVGYAVSAASRLGLLAAGASWPGIATMVALDRTAKGVRTVPRDLLISLSSTPNTLATSFGVHRALDSAGAMIGPLVALGILMALPDAFDVVFVASFSIAVCGIAVLLLFVVNISSPLGTAGASGSRAGLAMVLRNRGLSRVTIAVTVLSAATVSDGFIYLLLQRQSDFNAGLFPLLYVGTAACFLMLAVPAGRIADRLGREGALLGGYGLLALTYVATLREGIGAPGVLGCLLLLGGYYALTDGVLMALASTLLPEDLRGRGIGLLTTATSIARLVASVLFGALWTRYGMRPAVLMFLFALVVALVSAALLLRRRAIVGIDEIGSAS